MASRRQRRANKKLARGRIRRGKAARRAARRGGGSTPIRAASFGGLKSTIARAALKSKVGRRIATIARQQLSRIPGLGRLARTTRASRTGLVTTTGRQLATARTRGPASLARRTAITTAKVAATGAAFEVGSTVFSAVRGGGDVARRFQRGRGGSSPARRAGVPFTPGTVVPTDSITHTWIANGVPFAQLADGRVMVRKKNGVIKTFRRPKPIVLGRNPGIRDIARAYKKIDTLLKVMRKHFPAQKTRTQSRSPQQHRSVDV